MHTNKLPPGAIGCPGGFFMKSVYPVMMGHDAIGTANVQISGLYAKISCCCRFEEEGFYRVRLYGGKEQIDLGICIPVDGSYITEKSIPVKSLPKNDISFIAYEMRNAISIWRSGQEEVSVSDLRTSKRVFKDGVAMLVI